MWGIRETLGTLVLLALAALSPGEDDRWACDVPSRTGFTTDPVVHPVGISLREIVEREPDGAAFTVDHHGRTATVTHRDGDGLVVRRYEYSRGADTGWQLERGSTCAW